MASRTPSPPLPPPLEREGKWSVAAAQRGKGSMASRTPSPPCPPLEGEGGITSMITCTSAQLSAWYGAVFWPLVRVLALFTAAPLLSHRAIPLRIKVALGVAITVVLVPNVPTPPLSEVLSAAGLALLMQNILVGTVIRLTVRLVFASFVISGE